MTTTPLGVDGYRRIVVLTGAGISVASGLRTYRGAGGVWTTDPKAEAKAHVEFFRADPLEGWRFFSPMRERARAAEPNAAHLALAALEQRTARAGGSLTLVTQNVDGLHRRAGTKELVEYHGSILRTRCSNRACDFPPFEDTADRTGALAPCPRCGSWLRPDITLFGEDIDVSADHRVRRALRDCDLFLAVGTSGMVWPAAGFASAAAYAGARTVLVNLEGLEEEDESFREEYLGRAEEILPDLLR